MTQNIGDARNSDTAGQAEYNFPAGFVRVTDEPHQVFYDPFDAALDTANTWTTPTTGNAAVLAAVSAGTLSMGTGTTASGWSKLTSAGTFKPVVPSWLGYSFAILLPDGAAPTANAYRFWGAGTIPGVPTTAAPLTDAIGFELTTTGKLQAVVYAAGTRTLIADLSSTGTNTQPLDANNHRYIIYVRTDKTYFYIDNLITPVASSNFQAPQVQTLSLAMLAVGGATPPVSNTQIQCTGLAVWDTGKNAHQIADATYPWRRAQVSAAGAQLISSADGGQATIGTTTDVEVAAGNGTLVALLKRLRTLLNGGLPAALQTNGGLKTEGVAGGVPMPISGALTANQSVNQAQVAGTATDVNSGLKSAGTVRVVLATDQPQLTAKLLVTPDSVALPANQSVNTAQINGVAPSMGTGVVGTGVLRVVLATDQAALTTPMPVKDARSGTTANSSVTASLTVVTVLAANVNRLGATVYNEGTGILKLQLGASASATVYTVAMAAETYYEVPFGYTGILTGLWSVVASNAARVNELTT